MARKSVPLSDAQIKGTKPTPKEFNLADGEGLYLRVKPNGNKTWLFNYTKPVIEKRSNLKIGDYPEVSLKDARAKRQEYRELLAKGIDPQQHLAEQEQQKKLTALSTFEAVALDWFKLKIVNDKLSERYAYNIERSLQNHLFPFIGSYPISKLTAPQVIAVLKPLAAKGTLETVSRLCQRINEIMTYALNTGVIEQNPLFGIREAFETPSTENMPTLKPEELPKLMQALSTANINIITRCLIEFQLHTMVRPNEAAGAKWEEFDLEQMLWNIPKERMKGKKDKKQPHTVPITEQVLALLEVARPISGRSEFVFPADRDPKKPTHKETANRALQRMGFKGQLVSHGLRSLASTTLNDKGFDPDVIEKALAHSDNNQVRATYNHAKYIERRRKLMQWWSNHIEAAAKGNLSLAAGKKTLSLVG